MSVVELRSVDGAAHEALVGLEAAARELVVADAAAGTMPRYCWGAMVVHHDESEECGRGSACTGLPHVARTACTVFIRCDRCAGEA